MPYLPRLLAEPQGCPPEERAAMQEEGLVGSPGADGGARVPYDDCPGRILNRQMSMIPVVAPPMIHCGRGTAVIFVEAPDRLEFTRATLKLL